MTKRYPAWQYLLAGCLLLVFGVEMAYSALRSFFIAGNSLALNGVLLAFGLLVVVVGARYALRGYRLEVKGPSPADVL